jgi:ADP-ribosylglycohydrolase
MLGAIIGDMVGSVYEVNNIKSKEFPLFNNKNHQTDDSLLTIAVAQVLMKNAPILYEDEQLKKIQKDLCLYFQKAVKDNYNAGWGGKFFFWSIKPLDQKQPYNSFGNGAPMRISPVGWIAKSEEEVQILSQTITEITHNHPEGLKGAEAIAMSIFLARQGKSKDEIKDYVIQHYYPEIFQLDYEDLIKNYTYDISCQGSVSQAIFCFLISKDLTDAIKTAVSIGGDCDTIASMTGAIAEAYYHKDMLSSFEKKFIETFISVELQKLIIDFHMLAGSKKFMGLIDK